MVFCLELMNFNVDNANFYFQDKLAMNITLEQGKTLKGAESDVLHGIGQSLHVHYRSSCSVMMSVTNKWVTCLFFYFRGGRTCLWDGNSTDGGVCS